MNKHSCSIASRARSGIICRVGAVLLLSLAPMVCVQAQNPASGSVGPAPGGATASWQGTATAPGGGANTEADCVDGVNCEVFTLTVNGTVPDWVGQKVQVQLNWGSSLNEYDIYIHKGNSVSGTLVDQKMNGPGLTNQTAYIDVATWGTGTFTIHVVYDTTPNVTDHYSGSVIAVPVNTAPPPPAPQDTGPKIGYENFEPPGELTQVTASSSGGLTVEYLGRNGIEPSIGVNWLSAAPNNITGVTNYQSDLETLFVTFDDSCTAPLKSTWVNRRAPTSQLVDSDPIGFTDRQTGRVFAAELTLLSPDTVKISHTDDDGVTWAPDQTGGIASAVDHETIGGGPYHLVNGVAPPHSPTYNNAVYYASQDIATALCSRSDNGGSTYGPSIPMYNLTACQGLHGHLKVSPVDGTVYVPNRACGTVQSLVVSEDNGVTWAVKAVQTPTIAAAPSSVGTGDDPAVAVDNAGRVYFAFSNAGTAAGVAVSDNLGASWRDMYDVGAVYGLTNVCFPAAVAGDDGRAAIAFYGSTTPNDTTLNGKATGNSNTGSFIGVWHLYVAHTFDAGLHWTTTDITPVMPMQRSGLLRGGGADIVRNLADFFDVTIDKQGRVEVGYGNGCAGGNCAQAPVAADGTSLVRGNAYSATASIARQSSGRRMFAGNDPASATSAPGMPFVTQRRIGNLVRLAWNEADTGNSPITGYQILRSTTSGNETLLTTVPGTQIGGTYSDVTATDTAQTYYYEVVAVNSAGSSCPNNEIAAPYVGDVCNGVIIHKNDPTHPEATGGSGGSPPLPELLIDYIAISEPAGTDELMFKMKVGDLTTIPPNSRWRIAWDWWSPSNQMYYIGMTSDNTGAVTFEYGTLADAGVPAVLVLGETKIANIPQSPTGTHFDADGTITMFVPKSGVGNPKPGDLLGAIGGKTITGDTPQTATFERSTAFVDHTFIKGQADNSFPAATYTIAGNLACHGQLLNISSRLRVQTGDNVGIGGFIISGNAPKTVLIRALGPSLSPGVAGTLQDPTLALHDSSGNTIAFNDNWKSTQRSAIEATGLAPGNDAEAAMIVMLDPGSYTGIVAGKNATSGVALIEIYDIDQSSDSELGNLSTRGFVQTGDNVMIGGFIIGSPNGTMNVLLRGLGPSLSGSGLSNVLADPIIDLHDSNGVTIASNDDWQSSQQAAIQATGLAPSNTHEAAILAALTSGPYTAILRGKNNGTGIGLVEVYHVP